MTSPLSGRLKLDSLTQEEVGKPPVYLYLLIAPQFIDKKIEGTGSTLF
jgi:hypothetical protein